jgi:hypothetical protein
VSHAPRQFFQENIMARLHQILFGSAVLACAQLAFAQTAADITTGPHTPATVPPSAVPEANGAQTSGGVAPGTTPDQPQGGLVVGTIVQTQPPTVAPSAAQMSNDPFVQRREARAQARREYRARVQAAKEEYREDRRAADALLYQQSGN